MPNAIRPLKVSVLSKA